MIIKVTGSFSPKYSAEEVKETIEFFGRILMTKRMCNTLEIHVSGGPLPKNMKGMCGYITDADRPKDFEILVNTTFGKPMQIKTLAHEMVHVMQWATGKMKDMWRTDAVKYSGKYYYTSTENLDVDYYYWPWEVEAYGLETGLYEDFRLYEKARKRGHNIQSYFSECAGLADRRSYITHKPKCKKSR